MKGAGYIDVEERTCARAQKLLNAIRRSGMQVSKDPLGDGLSIPGVVPRIEGAPSLSTSK